MTRRKTNTSCKYSQWEMKHKVQIMMKGDAYKTEESTVRPVETPSNQQSCVESCVMSYSSVIGGATVLISMLVQTLFNLIQNSANIGLQSS